MNVPCEFDYAGVTYGYDGRDITEAGDHCIEAPNARDEGELRFAVMAWLQGRRQGHAEGCISQQFVIAKALGLNPSCLAKEER